MKREERNTTIMKIEERKTAIMKREKRDTITIMKREERDTIMKREETRKSEKKCSDQIVISVNQLFCHYGPNDQL